jgi:hypothetical protein
MCVIARVAQSPAALPGPRTPLGIRHAGSLWCPTPRTVRVSCIDHFTKTQRGAKDFYDDLALTLDISMGDADSNCSLTHQSDSGYRRKKPRTRQRALHRLTAWQPPGRYSDRAQYAKVKSPATGRGRHMAR